MCVPLNSAGITADHSDCSAPSSEEMSHFFGGDFRSSSEETKNSSEF